MITETSKRTTRIAETRRRWILRSCFFLIFTFLWMCIGYLWMIVGPGARELGITISVFDAETGAPLPNAKLSIRTRRYGLVNDSSRVFVISADDDGRAALKQPIDYAIGYVGVSAWNPRLTRWGAQSVETFARSPGMHLLQDAPSSPEYVHFHPNRRHFNVYVRELGVDNKFTFRDAYERATKEAGETQRLLNEKRISLPD